MSDPLVSIVIPSLIATGSQAELLDETLGTLSAQTFTDFEAIVVDDGSPIDVARIVSVHPRTVSVRQANAGSAVAGNTGIARSDARGEPRARASRRAPPRSGKPEPQALLSSGELLA